MIKREIWKKVMAACLAGCMVLSLAACGSDKISESASGEKESQKQQSSAASEEESYFNVTGYPICDETITITVSGQNASTPDWNDTELVQEIEKRFGIAMECNPYEQEAWETQYTLMIASDEVPDLILNMSRTISEVNEHGQEGYFLPLNEYLDYMPNFKAFLEAHPDYKASITSNDGNIYGLTQYNENEVTKLKRSFINKVWLDNVGKEMPTTVDELYDVLKAFKEQDANGNGDPDDEIPLSGDFYTLQPILHAFGIFSNSMEYGLMLDDDGNVVLGQATENYKAMLKYIKKLYDEGLYDADGLVQTYDELLAKCQDERVGMYTTGSAPYVMAGQDISYDVNWDYIAGLTSEYNAEAVCVYASGVTNTVKIAVSADTEYPEAIARLLDYFYTPEGSITASRGFEGISHEKVAKEDFNNAVVVQLFEKEGYSQEEYRYKKALINEGFNVLKFYTGSTYQVLADMSDSDLVSDAPALNDWSAHMERGRRKLGRVDEFPSLIYTDEELERRNTLTTDVIIYIEQAFGQFVVGELDIDTEWDSYLKTLERIGLSELLEIEQAAYDRMYK